MSEYQQKKMKSYLLPEAVYRQALWAVKDLPRMREKLMELEQSIDRLPQTYTAQPRCSGIHADLTAARAGQMASLAMRIRIIEDSLKIVPEKYQDGILDKVAYGIPYPDLHHSNTWKRWQQVFLYQVAVGLQLY
ncbi:MAG: hypothetical protein IJ443_07605 [Firmicutes bacterium]|nr:hypothetical protein [Bacillota bacterium]